MLNAATKAIILGAAAMLCACGADHGERQAADLLQQAREAVDRQDFRLAAELCDSLKRAYPAAVKERREALHIASRANEGLVLQDYQQTDSLLAVLGVRADSLKSLLTYVPNSIEGYYIPAGARTEDVYTRTGLQARMSPDGDFYMIATLADKGRKFSSVTVYAASEEATTTSIPYDGERNLSEDGVTTVTFLAAECDSVGSFVHSHPGAAFTVTFNDGASHKAVQLPAAAASGISNLYEYALTLRQAKVAAVRREKLRKAIDLSRSQSARTFVEKDTL